MIKSTINIHDKFSVVIEATYDNLLTRKKSEYTCITYLYFPNSLNVNNKTYPKSKFYNDVRLYLKYTRPNYQLNEIYNGPKSPLKRLEKNTQKYLENNSGKEAILYEDQVKMFAYIFCTLLVEQTNNILTSKNVDTAAITGFINTITKILTQFRLQVELTANSPIDPDKKNYMFYADEHMSNMVELQMKHLYNKFYGKLSREDTNPIIALIDYEQKYKKQRDYSSPKDKSMDPEKLVYKRHQLKKYIDSVSFLNQEVRRDGELAEQTLLAVAAGLAMVFATAVAFYFQQYYGNFTTPFFLALVVGYMLKDRIKSLTSQYFISKSSSLFYDYKINITDSLKKKIGIIKESFNFIPFEKLGTTIQEYRLKDRVVKTTVLAEQIIQYKKKVSLYSEFFGSDLPDEEIIGLTDVTRLNFHRFIQYMDDPERDFILVKKGEVYTQIAEKVYPINIIQQYFTEGGDEFRRYRVIINRNGIKRIEPVELN